MAFALLYGSAAMNPSIRRQRRAAGFTLIELLVSFAILMTLVLLVGPPLAKFIQRSKLTGAVQQTAMAMRMARMQAIKHSAEAVVRLQPATNPPSVIAFIDLDRDGVKDANEKTVSSVLMERGIRFLDSEPAGFTDAVFQETGSAAAQGAFRFADTKGNEMEVQVFKETGRIEIRKKEGSDWITPGQGGKAWTWK